MGAASFIITIFYIEKGVSYHMPPDPEGNSLSLLQAAPAAGADFSGGTLAVQILLLLVLILLNAFFAMSEIAIVTLNDNKIRKMAEDGHKGAAKVLKLTKNNSFFQLAHYNGWTNPKPLFYQMQG